MQHGALLHCGRQGIAVLLAQLDRAFDQVAARSGPAEALHHAVNSQVSDAVFALYRDFPDRARKRGEERF